MLHRAVFLDRDNTIIENDGYLGDPSKVKLMPGAATALSAIRALGYRLIVVSNQSGVARGMFDEAAVESVNQEMSRQLQEQAGAYVDASYYCPYHPEAPLQQYKLDHEWRKPKPGMLKQAAADFGLELAQCWMVGDQSRDVGAGAAAGCRTILLRDPSRSPATETDSGISVSPSFVVRTLADAARIIAREGRNPSVPPVKTPMPVSQAAPETASSGPSAGSSNAEAVKEKSISTGPATPSPRVERYETATPDHTRDRSSHQPSIPAAGGVSPALEKSLDDLVAHLRLQNRNLDLKPEFTFASISAMILQVLAVGALIFGMHAFVAAPVTFKVGNDLFLAEIAHEDAMIWLLVALVLQGMVIALLIKTRSK